MNHKNNSLKQNKTRPNLERFKYEVAQEMGLSSRNKTVNKDNEFEQQIKGFKNGKTF